MGVLLLECGLKSLLLATFLQENKTPYYYLITIIIHTITNTYQDQYKQKKPIYYTFFY